jgi:hypothetical protein
MTLTAADEAFCRIMAKKLLKNNWAPSSVLDHIQRRAQRPVVLDLRGAHEPVTMTASAVAEELGVKLDVVLEELWQMLIPQVGRGSKYRLDEATVRALRARIGAAP